jgi:sodium-dependent dicarboxylate transporter 2/3/5
LILFGGGLALAAAITSSGLALWLGTQLAVLGAVNTVLLIIAATALVIFLTELTSNLATTATFLPVIAAIGVETGQDPLIYVIPVTLAASCAFMLPVATPPNAVVFSSGLVAIPTMARVGLALNIIAVVVLSLVSLLIAPAVF